MSFKQVFQVLIFPSSIEFSQQVFRASLSYQKRVYQEWFSWVFKSFFLSFLFPNLSSFVTQAWAFSLPHLSYRIFVCESACWWSREEITKCSNHYIWRSCRGCGLGELVGSCVLFLREQVRDLRVQEFLREIVQVLRHRVICRIVIVEILHSIEGGDGEQVCSNLEITIPCL